MDIKDAWIVTGLGISVVFSGLLLTNLTIVLITNFSRIFGKKEKKEQSVATEVKQHSKEVKSISRTTGKTCQHTAVVQCADLGRIAFKYRITEGYLPVTTDDRSAFTFVSQYRGCFKHLYPYYFYFEHRMDTVTKLCIHFV